MQLDMILLILPVTKTLDKMTKVCKIKVMKTEPANQDNDFVSLYRSAFKEFGASALWSSRPVPDPTCEDALAITWSLRVEGDLRARKLAEQIEQACRATV
jgi:hypothetical protein